MKTCNTFISLLEPYKSKVLYCLLAIFIANIAGMVFPFALKIIIDNVISKNDYLLFNYIAAGLILSIAVKAYFGFVREKIIAFLGERVMFDLRKKIFAHIQKLSVKYIDNNSKGRIISRIIGDVDKIRQFIFNGSVDFIYSLLNLLFVITMLFILDWKLTLISLVYLPVFAFTFAKWVPKLQAYHRQLRDEYGNFTSLLNETLNGMRIIAGFGRAEYEKDKFNSTHNNIFSNAMNTHTISAWLWTASEFFSSMGLATLIWFGVRAVIDNRITTGTLMAFYSYSGMLFFPVVKMSIINNYYQQAKASIKQINDILLQQPEGEYNNQGIKNTIKGNVIFKNVYFSYDLTKPILSNININAPEATVTALVGRSGAGKSSVINLLLGFYKPLSGEILIDGYNINQLNTDNYRLQTAVVLQDDYLFNGTIKENIQYGKLTATEQEMIESAKRAHAHEFITKLPEQYNTVIGERGIKLSYGQRQRISIARAILRDPAILILDEPTSSVDIETERIIIDKAFKNLMTGRTVFVIAHKFSTILFADKILLIDDGQIIEQGSHKQLLDKKGRYWELWLKQQL